MWEPFTEPARLAMVSAQSSAVRLRYDTIGPEHVLIGLLSDESGTARQVMKRIGVDVDKLVADLEIPGTSSAKPKEMLFTGTTTKAIETAFEEARGLGHKFIGPEHLLLALLRVHQGVVAETVRRHGISIGEVRQAVQSDGSRPSDTPQVTVSAEVRAVIGRSESEARKDGQDQILGQHLLLALLHQETSRAARALGRLGVDAARLRETLRQLQDEEK